MTVGRSGSVVTSGPFPGGRASAEQGPPAAAKGASADVRRELHELYLRRHDRINDWDLVDLGAWNVVGRFLADQPREVLDRLAASPDAWERRTAIQATKPDDRARFLARRGQNQPIAG